MRKVVGVWSTAGISLLPLLSFFFVIAVNQIRAGGEWGGNLLLLWFASNTNNSSSPQIWERLRGIKNKRSWVQTPFGLVKKPTCWIHNHRTQNLVSVPVWLASRCLQPGSHTAAPSCLLYITVDINSLFVSHWWKLKFLWMFLNFNILFFHCCVYNAVFTVFVSINTPVCIQGSMTVTELFQCQQKVCLHSYIWSWSWNTVSWHVMSTGQL